MELKELVKQAYYSEKGGMLLMGDCIEWMKEIPDQSVDMILADLPYGTTACKWDSIIPFDLLWEQYERIIKNNGAIVLTGSQPFTSSLVMSNPKMFRYEWIWDKHISRGMSQAKYQPMRKHENILVFSKKYPFNYYPIMIERDKPVTVKNYQKEEDSFHGKYKDNTKQYTYTHKNPDTIIIGCWEANRGKIHPTQKPVTLFEYLIKTYTNEGEIVLDNVAGSCTTAIASKNTNRRWICIEKEQKYCDISVDRIKNHKIS